ncbi:Tryptophan--tRNA ligase, mitochondrial [Neocucurbitaria cava]|uniref:tryptophan--tRNA ligase n=1 Tax=Neocucurbitaria cava TaxID=798079 RepID=A0A9W8Y400_9PLEO|nr:Tryptophan--tRNA ligase, mitochondrial [Neocucurbitaria cava]
MGYLGRMTQWKSKLSLPSNASPLDPSPSNKDALKLGLFSYPVLQAADILLYNTTHVPVGEDQAQHLEFSRELAIGFNHLYSTSSSSEPLLTVPQTLLSPAKRVMSLTEPTKKMSKSDPKPKSRILITDSREEIHNKLKSALTDSIEGVSYDRDSRPGVSNLVDLIYHFDESLAASPEELAKDLKGLSMRALKERAADTVDAGIRDIRERYEELMGGNQKALVQHADDGARRAEEIAEATMKRVRSAMGIGW